MAANTACFREVLEPLQERSIVGEVRQLGMMAASELVADKKSKKIDSQRIQNKNAAFAVCFVGYPEEIRQIPS
ncbi:MAG: aminotransferase class III-fold pyridoxal phosphate-dependent enzyme [Planctomycetota bacterium]|nr:MAG: aminotransferase class III-fold pyridoxal phosphate-dependent enzyme [Planctomycetota bacterium]